MHLYGKLESGRLGSTHLAVAVWLGLSRTLCVPVLFRVRLAVVPGFAVDRHCSNMCAALSNLSYQCLASCKAPTTWILDCRVHESQALHESQLQTHCCLIAATLTDCMSLALTTHRSKGCMTVPSFMVWGSTSSLI